MNEEINSGTKAHAAPEDDSSQAVEPSENEPIQVKAQHEGLSKRLANHASTARSIVVNALLLALVVAMGVVLARELSRDTVIVEPLGVPKGLAERGYTGEILARRLIDELTKIRKGASTRKNDINPEVLPDWSQPDIQIPGAPMSLRSIVRYVQESFSATGLHISGEVTRYENGLRLRLRERGSGTLEDVQVNSVDEIDRLLQFSARELQKKIDPYVLASYLKDKDINQALGVIAYCLANEPTADDPWAYNLWGLILKGEGQYDRALEYFAKAIKVQNDFVLAYSNSGIALAHLKRFSEAAAKHEAAMRIAPNDPHVYTSWGRSLTLEKHGKQAIEKFKTAVSLDPKNAHAYNEWGRALSEKGDMQGAMEKFEVVVRLLPDNKVANNNYGNELRRIQRYEEAVQYFKRAIALERDYGAAYYNLGLLYEEQRHHGRARLCYDKALATEGLTGEEKKIVKQDRKKLLARYPNANKPPPEGHCT